MRSSVLSTKGDMYVFAVYMRLLWTDKRINIVKTLQFDERTILQQQSMPIYRKRSFKKEIYLSLLWAAKIEYFPTSIYPLQ